MWTTRNIDSTSPHTVDNPERIVLVASLVCLTCFLLSLVDVPNFGATQLSNSPAHETASSAGD